MESAFPSFATSARARSCLRRSWTSTCHSHGKTLAEAVFSFSLVPLCSPVYVRIFGYHLPARPSAAGSGPLPWVAAGGQRRAHGRGGRGRAGRRAGKRRTGADDCDGLFALGDSSRSRVPKRRARPLGVATRASRARRGTRAPQADRSVSVCGCVELRAWHLGRPFWSKSRSHHRSAAADDTDAPDLFWGQAARVSGASAGFGARGGSRAAAQDALAQSPRHMRGAPRRARRADGGMVRAAPAAVAARAAAAAAPSRTS